MLPRYHAPRKRPERVPKAFMKPNGTGTAAPPGITPLQLSRGVRTLRGKTCCRHLILDNASPGSRLVVPAHRSLEKTAVAPPTPSLPPYTSLPLLSMTLLGVHTILPPVTNFEAPKQYHGGW